MRQKPWQKKVIRQLPTYGGRLVIFCGQGNEPMLSVLRSHVRSSSGICLTLAKKWMCELSNGRDFWDWMMPGGQLNAAAAASITIQHVDKGRADVPETTSGQRAPSHSGTTDAQFLAFYGQLESSKLVIPGGASGFGNPPAGEVPAALGAVVRDKRPPAQAYALFNMHADGASGHSVAAEAMNYGMVRFYDPNIGEMVFERADSFAGWMADVLGSEVYQTYTAFNYRWYSRSS